MLEVEVWSDRQKTMSGERSTNVIVVKHISTPPSGGDRISTYQHRVTQKHQMIE